MINNVWNIIVFFIILFLSFNRLTLIQAQEKIKVHVSGTSISLNKTPKEALKQAIFDAQQKAYGAAGIIEDISVSTTLYESSTENEVNRFFSEISTIESNASILVDSVYPEKRSFDEFGNMVVQVEIDATVFKYKKEKDWSFFFRIGGLKDTYYENESISFDFTPSQNGYLRVFEVNEKDAFLLYPYNSTISDYLNDKPDQLFLKDEIVCFPVHPAYKPGYSIELETKDEPEINNLIFVYLKRNIPLLDDRLNLNIILKWIFNIPVDQRSVEFKSITVKPLQ
ncbi:MAG: hypothetical protein H8E98_04770 [Bacteroidetes bacterium]|nr:hypothetical protein [Bacteroidota bacterium]